MATDKEIKEFIKANRGGTVEEYYGPVQVGSAEIWEVWVFQSDEWQTRFVKETSEKGLTYFGDFSQLAVDLSREMRRYLERAEDVAPKRQSLLVRLYVSSSVFLVSVGVLLFLVIKGAEPNATTYGTFATLIGSGALLFYGAWKPEEGPAK